MADERLQLFDQFALDVARGSLLRGREPVHLRPQAYEVLKYLVEHRGRLVSKDALIQAVWHGRAVTDDSLVQCLRDVRHALDDPRGLQIRNVRGRGYIFDPEGGGPSGDAPEMPEAADSSQPAGDGFARVRSREPIAVSAERTHGEHSPRTRAIPPAAFAASAGLVLLSVAAGGYWFATDPPAARAVESIAVLPFANESGDREADYLSDGLTDSLINSLSHVPGLSVKSRSSVFRYKGGQVEPQRVARELSVQAVLTGRAVQRQDGVTLYLSQVDGRTGNQLWGAEYTRRLVELAATQQEITRDIAERLRLTVSPAEHDRVRRDHTANPEAYLSYLRGRHYAFKTTEPEIRRAISFYQRALDADPLYALAYAGMADAYRALSIVGLEPSSEAFPQARAAARRALEIDDTLSDAHVALGWILFSFDWDWQAAERELRRAIELRPGSPDAHRAYAHLLSNIGRHEEALAEARIARELDPLILLTNALEGQFLFYAGRDAEAEARYRKTLELEPNYWVAHNGLGRVYLHRRMFPEAVAAFRAAVDLAAKSSESLTQLGYVLARWGRREEARATIRQLESLAAGHYVPAYAFAMIYNGLGERDRALRYLEQSLDQREVQLTFIKIDTRWDPIRADPRFRAIARRVGLE